MLASEVMPVSTATASRRGRIMPDLLIRKLDPSLVDRLKAQAKRNGRSMEAEARAILEEHVEMSMNEWLDAMHELTKDDPPPQPGEPTVVDLLRETRQEMEDKIDRLIEESDRRGEDD